MHSAINITLGPVCFCGAFSILPQLVLKSWLKKKECLKNLFFQTAIVKNYGNAKHPLNQITSDAFFLPSRQNKMQWIWKQILSKKRRVRLLDQLRCHGKRYLGLACFGFLSCSISCRLWYYWRSKKLGNDRRGLQSSDFPRRYFGPRLGMRLAI